MRQTLITQPTEHESIRLERELRQRVEREESRVHRIVGRGESAAGHRPEEPNAHHVHLHAMEVGASVVHLANHRLQAGLLQQFAACGLTHIFVVLDPAAREVPQASVLPVSALREQQSVAFRRSARRHRRSGSGSR